MEFVKRFSRNGKLYAFSYDGDTAIVSECEYPIINPTKSGDVWIYNKLNYPKPCISLVMFNEDIGHAFDISIDFKSVYTNRLHEARFFDYHKSRYIGRLDKRYIAKDGRHKIDIDEVLERFELIYVKMLLSSEVRELTHVDGYVKYFKEMMRDYCCFVV